MIHVCMVNRTTNVGGVERILQAYAAGFSGRPVRLDYAYTPFPGDAPHVAALQALGVGLRPLADSPRAAAASAAPGCAHPNRLLALWKVLVPARADQLVFQLRQARRLRPELAARLRAGGAAPDLCHLHAGYYGWLAAGVQACRRAFPGVPVIVHLHNPPAFFTPTWCERRALRGADAVVFVSRPTQQAWEQQVGPLPRARVLPSPVVVELPPAPARPAGARPLILGLVGRLSPIKGTDIALRAAAALLAEGAAIELWVLGKGPEEDRLRELARALNIAGHVRFHGFVPEPLALLRAMDVLLQPSLSTEGVPISVLEAMAAGLPVIATPVGGVPEIIADGVTGFLVAPGSADGLAACVRRLLAAPAERAAVGQRAAEFVRERHAAPRAAAALEELYHQVLAARPRHHSSSP